MATTGGQAQQVTQGGSGKFASETADGDSLVYQPKDSDSPLLVKPLTGGPARQLVACVKQTAFGVGLQGVYYVPCDPTPNPPLHVIDPNTGRDRRLGTLEQFERSPTAPPSVCPFRQTGSDPVSQAHERHCRPHADRELPVTGAFSKEEGLHGTTPASSRIAAKKSLRMSTSRLGA